MDLDVIGGITRSDWNHQIRERNSESDEKSDQDDRICKVTKEVDFETSNARSKTGIRIFIGAANRCNRALRYLSEILSSISITTQDNNPLNELFSEFNREIRSYRKSGLLSSWQAALLQAKDIASRIALGEIDIDTQDKDGNTLLHLVCDNNMLEVAYYLLNNGANIDIYNNNWLRPSLDKCIVNGDTVLHYLFKNSEEDNERNEDKHVILCIKLISRYPEFVNLQNDNGKTPLMYGCANGYPRCVDLLLDCPEINLELTDQKGETAANHAIYSRNPRIIESVLNRFSSAIKGVELYDKIDRDDNTLLHYAFKIFNLKLIEQFTVGEQFSIGNDCNMQIFFIPNKFGDTPISYIARSKDLIINMEVLRAVDQRIKFNYIFALFTREIAKFDQEIKDYILSLAVVNKYYETAMLLLQNGADCNAPVKIIKNDDIPNAINVLMFLLYTSDDNVTLRTILKECRVNFQMTAGGLSLLHFACLGGNYEMFNELTQRGLSIHAVGTEGKFENLTVFMGAVLGKNEKIVNTLFNKVDIDVRSSNGLTAFDYAILGQDINIVYRFLQHKIPVRHSINNFDFFVERLGIVRYEEIQLQFKRVIREMIGSCPELILRIAVRKDGEKLYCTRNNDNFDLENSARDVIDKPGAILIAFPELESITSDLNNNNPNAINLLIEKLKPSEFGIAIFRACFNSIDEKASQVFNNAFQRYEQISKIEIETKKIDPYEFLKMALFIECQIRSSLKIKDFFERNEILPRSIILHKREIVILARHKFAILRAEGGLKRINNAVRVSLENLHSQPSNVAVVKIRPCILKNKKHHPDHYMGCLMHEWMIMRKFKHKEGFVRGYFFSDIKSSNGNMHYIVDKYENDIGVLVGGALSLRKQINIAEQAISHLITMHDLKVMHGDLKPKNIVYLIDADQNIKIAFTDFGHSMEMQEGMNWRKKHATPKHNSPELEYNFATSDVISQCENLDIYSLGLILFMLRYGDKFPIGSNDNINTVSQNEFKMRHDKIVRDRLVEICNKDIRHKSDDDMYDSIILKMLRYYPEDRITLKDALKEIHKIIG